MLPNLKNIIKTKISNIISYHVYQTKYELISSLIDKQVLYQKEKGITDYMYMPHKIIVSLTTHGNRLYQVHRTIESIMEQTIKANKIILWIDNKYQNELPEALVILQNRGLEIKFRKDIRSYTKLIYALKEYPNDAIITIDDDLIYNFDILEKLIKSYIKNPQYIYANRIHRITFDNKNNILPYKQWQTCINDYIVSPLNFFTGVGGVLYPPNSLDNEVTNENIFLDICKYADDVWFNAMAIKKGTLSQKVFTHNEKGNDYILNLELESKGLNSINVQHNLNDIQIENVYSKYNLKEKLSFDRINNKNYIE